MSESPRNRLSTEAKVSTALAVALAVLLVSAVGVWHMAGKLTTTTDWIVHTHRVLETIAGIEAAIGQAEATQRAYLLAGDDAWLLQQETALSRLETHFQNLLELTADNPNQQARLTALEPALVTWRQVLNENQLVRQLDGEEAARERVGRNLLAQSSAAIARLLAAMRNEERALLEMRRMSEATLGRRALVWLALLGAVSFIYLGMLFFHIRREMRERRRVSEELARQTTRLEMTNRELESFSYSVSHDLRAPLRAVEGFTRMLEEDYGPTLDDEGRRLLRVVQDNARRMGRLIDDLLSFSRLGRQPLTFATVDMRVLAAQAAAEAGTAAANPSLTIDIGELPPARGDPALIAQVWANLIHNAVKYSARSPAPIVRITARRDGADNLYSVSDNGVGFDMRYAGKLFGVFQRLHGQDEFPGTGVGLAIVQRIITRHGGRIWAEAEPGHGATFHFTLPRSEGYG
ncbi:MAG TPA: CHASE3 domain-containing protein [Gammaproteobacteria bacterium]|nr:CHASE3 domain-containing protein [Gammaproteobacteria bacterium]